MSLEELLGRFRSEGGEGCGCETSFVDAGPTAGDRAELRVRADDCPAGGDLVESPDCMATVVDALADRDARAVTVSTGGVDRTYVEGVGLLIAAGRFVARVTGREPDVAAVARRDPLRAARLSTGRADDVSRLAATTGLDAALELVPADAGSRTEAYGALLRSVRSPTVGDALVDTAVPGEGATTQSTRTLPTGATVRICMDGDRPCYHLTPVEAGFDDDEMETLAAAAEAFASGRGEPGPRAIERAVRTVLRTNPDIAPAADRLAAVLEKHTLGLGVLDDLFADRTITDVFVTAPVGENPVRVVADGERLPTNVTVTPAGAAALASRLRAESGRPFSRAVPTVDATLESTVPVRVAGVADPASDGYAFALRRPRGEPWRLPELVGNGTVTPEVAALLSLAVERGAATLVAGGRGAGKTTLLGALLWELPPTTRTVAVEDTPELPVASLQRADRDVQRLRVGTGDDPGISPTAAVRSALRLGDGALVVGEVRGEEARALYEAMRVGSTAHAVLGTIHGRDETAIRERLVTDLGVPPSSFAATDLLVTLDSTPRRHVGRVVEVRRTESGARLVPLFTRIEEQLEASGVLVRGESELLAGLAAGDEDYGSVLDALDRRTDRFRGGAKPDDGDGGVRGDEP